MVTWCQHSQQLRWHDVSVVNSYADMCQRNKRIRGHRVSVVNDYADIRKIILLYFGKSIIGHEIFELCNWIYSRKRKGFYSSPEASPIVPDFTIFVLGCSCKYLQYFLASFSLHCFLFLCFGFSNAGWDVKKWTERKIRRNKTRIR